MDPFLHGGPAVRASFSFLTSISMHSDARTLADGSKIEGDLCIIGAGAAGISIAKEFVDTSYDVILLEAGGFERDPDVQALYKGTNTGLPYHPPSTMRLRYFGGTTGLWNGWCSRLDPIDFEERDWVPMSGWPFSLKELEPYYRRAHPVLDLGEYNYNVDYWSRQKDGFSPFPFDESNVRTKVFKWSAPTRFGEKYRTEITQAENLTLWTHANVTEIQASSNGSEVTGLRVQCLNGKEHRVRARKYVLACGGLENPRLLLNSNREYSDGLGNENGLVGRYFMEHPHVPSANLVLTEPPSAGYRRSQDAGEPFYLLSLSPRQQRRQHLLNYSAALRRKIGSDFDRSLPNWMYKIPNVRGLENRVKYYFSSESDDAADDDVELGLSTRIEQRPNPKSRVSLSSQTDELGQRRIELNWDLTEDEKRTIQIANETIGKELGRLGIGRLQMRNWLRTDSDTWPDDLHGGHHHMGTTRMSESPRRGVVDANCKVHGIENLHVAGSSVFPTSGAANPTLTIVALALRLSDHLKEELKS